MKVAIIGGGISGLACAYTLARSGAAVEVTLFEANGYVGGHTNTVDVTLDGMTHGVDTGFLVFNHRTYPNLVRLFDDLGVATTATDMSFSVALTDRKFEWAGSDLNTVFAQRRNLLRPAFLRMLADILRFNRTATALALAGENSAQETLAEPVSRFLERERFSTAFRDWYLLPMIGAIWSCPLDRMMAFPVGTLIHFCHNHGLLQINDRPQWRTVDGGAREYVRRMLPHIADARVGQPVHAVRRVAGQVEIRSARGVEHFDHAVLACHSDQTLRLLDDASPDERATLGAIGYAPNRAVLHTDASLLPSPRAWSAWNYESRSGELGRDPALCVHYLINRLQPLPFKTPVIVSLNPVREPRADCVIREFAYSHPIFDQAAVAAQQRLPALQGVRNTWFCGAWTGYGFHEDGLKSGLAAASALIAASKDRRDNLVLAA
jgi:predicted NAD/FAD-binding protein